MKKSDIEMKLVEKTYSFINEKLEESLSIKVNDELTYDHIKIEELPCWRTNKQMIEYYEWLVECVKQLPSKGENKK